MKMTLVDAVLEKGTKRNQERTEMEIRRRIPNERRKNLLLGEGLMAWSPAMV